MKKCSKCGEDKPLDMFSKYKSSKDGLQSQCKGCVSQYNRDRYRKNKQDSEVKAPSYKACPVCEKVLPASAFHASIASKDRLSWSCRECRNARARVRRNNDIENSRRRCREGQRKAYSTEEGKVRLRNNAYRWAKRNPEKAKAIQHNRRAESVGKLDPEKWKNRLDYYGGKCVYCNTENDITIEHRIPISRGGTNLPANLVPACKSCNCKKGTKTETEFKLFLSQEQVNVI